MYLKKSYALSMGMTFFLSFASLIYEFIIAQILAALAGGTVKQYSITIAVYTFCLGLGSYLYTFLPKERRDKNVFSHTELALSFLAVLLPLGTLLLPASTIIFGVRADLALAYSSMVFLGLLSGLELPFLLDLIEEKGVILGLDYLGMFAASILFPWLFFPKLGLLPTVFCVASINLACALAISRNKLFLATGVLCSISTFIAVSFYFVEINEFTTALFLEKHNG